MNNTKSDMIAVMRVAACLLVLGVHTRMYIGYKSGGVTDIITANGQDGLWIFMILSGYLLYYSYVKSKSLKEYFTKRALRLIPAYWGWLICIMFYGLITGNFHMRLFDWLRSFFFMTLIIPSTNFEGLWGLGRLSSFFVAYLLFPIVYKKIKTIDQGMVLALVTLFVKLFGPMVINIILTRWPVQSNMDFVGITPLSDFCYFAIGYVIVLGEKERQENKVLMLLIGLFIFQLRWAFGWNIVLSVGVVSAILIYYPVKLPDYIVKLCKALGAYTYPIYICHASIYALLNKYVQGLNKRYMLILMLAGAAAGAVFVRLMFEKPVAILRKKYFMAKG